MTRLLNNATIDAEHGPLTLDALFGPHAGLDRARAFVQEEFRALQFDEVFRCHQRRKCPIASCFELLVKFRRHYHDHKGGRP